MQHTDFTSSRCPECQISVDDEANQCHECGAMFPNLRQREGNVWGGFWCGLARGVGILAFVVTGVAILRLLTPPFEFGEAALAVMGAVVFALALLISSRLSAATYHIED